MSFDERFDAYCVRVEVRRLRDGDDAEIEDLGEVCLVDDLGALGERPGFYSLPLGPPMYDPFLRVEPGDACYVTAIGCHRG